MLRQAQHERENYYGIKCARPAVPDEALAK
jgi:hypothetical protein